MELARCLVFAFVSFVIPIIIATTALVQRYQETAKDAMRRRPGVYVPPQSPLQCSYYPTT